LLESRGRNVGDEATSAPRQIRTRNKLTVRMPDDSLSKRLALINTLLRPIQKTIRELLPDFIDRNLRKKTVRAAIVTAVDATLIRQFPIARIFPPEMRQRLIRSQLDLVLDELVLKDSLPTDDLARAFGASLLRRSLR